MMVVVVAAEFDVQGASTILFKNPSDFLTLGIRFGENLNTLVDCLLLGTPRTSG
jgi:hypothetical protein